MLFTQRMLELQGSYGTTHFTATKRSERQVVYYYFNLLQPFHRCKLQLVHIDKDSYTRQSLGLLEVLGIIITQNVQRFTVRIVHNRACCPPYRGSYYTLIRSLCLIIIARLVMVSTIIRVCSIYIW